MTQQEQVQAPQEMNTVVECDAEAILRQMDEQFIDLVDYELAAKTTKSPEREVPDIEGVPPSVNIAVPYSKLPNDGLPRHMLLNCSSVVEKRRNPELTSPMNAVSDSWSCSSIASSQFDKCVDSPIKRREPTVVGDEGIEASMPSDEEDSLAPPAPECLADDNETDSLGFVQDAIDSIREEANRMDTVFENDKCRTLQSEMSCMTKLLQAQTEQIEHLKRQLKQKDEQLATVELERDLCKADIEALLVAQQVAASKETKTKRVDGTSPLELLDSSFATAVASLGGDQSQDSGATSLSESEDTARSIVEGRKIDMSLASGATMASSEMSHSEESPLSERKVCELDMSAEIKELGTNVASATNALLRSPWLPVPIGPEKYCCESDLGAVEGVLKPAPASGEGIGCTSPQDPDMGIPMRTGRDSTTESFASAPESACSSRDDGTPLCEKPTYYRGPALTVDEINKVTDHTAERRNKLATAGLSAGPFKFSYTKDKAPFSVRGDRNKGTKQILAVTKPVPVRVLESSHARQRPAWTLGSWDKAIKHATMASEDSSQGSSKQGSFKENRLPVKKPSHFKPIHPGKEKATPQEVHNPIPRKPASPSMLSVAASIEPKSTREEVAMSLSEQNSLISTSFLNETSVSFPEKKDQTGVFPVTEKSMTMPAKEEVQNRETPRQWKAGMSIFRRKKSQGKVAAMEDGTTQGKQRSTLTDKQLEQEESLQSQVEELAQRLRSSLEGSDDLRKRLAMISRYYETTVHQLSDNIVALKKEQKSMEVDLTKQMRSIDRERLVAIKRTELLLKEQEMAKFKKKNPGCEMNSLLDAVMAIESKRFRLHLVL